VAALVTVTVVVLVGIAIQEHTLDREDKIAEAEASSAASYKSVLVEFMS